MRTAKTFKLLESDIFVLFARKSLMGGRVMTVAIRKMTPLKTFPEENDVIVNIRNTNPKNHAQTNERVMFLVFPSGD